VTAGVIKTPPKDPRKPGPGAKDPGTSAPKSNRTPQQKADDSARAAENRAVARADADKRKAGKRFLESAANLEAQAKAIREALKRQFGHNRDNNLRDVSRSLTEQLTTLKAGSKLRALEFLKTGSDTEKATSDAQESAFSNATRERQDTMTEVLTQGAGETDTMRAMLMAARNWHANASEQNRSYYDTMRTVNAGITDLNVDTQTALANAARTAEGQREQVWQDFYNKRGEAFTQLGNVKGQQAEYYAQAKEMGVAPKKGVEAAAEAAMKKAFMDSAKEAGKSYTQKTLPKWISGYQGQAAVETRQSNTNLAAAVTMDPLEKAEGASLRKWAA
jgi:hypothetical protein